MQYPIIDNLIYAYQRNGWTGLDITEKSTNLAFFPPIDYESPYLGITYDIRASEMHIEGATTGTNNPYLASHSNNYNDMPIQLQAGTYSITATGLIGVSASDRIVVTVRNANGTEIVSGQRITGEPGQISTGIGRKVTFTANETVRLGFYMSLAQGGTFDSTIRVQLNRGAELLPYEEYAPPTTDIASRLKLPLPHYFPHPVIDALQRAASGTQTAEDTEVLRHYLTPFGIGGI